MNQGSDNNYFHIPLPGDETQREAGFYSSPPISNRKEVAYKVEKQPLNLSESTFNMNPEPDSYQTRIADSHLNAQTRKTKTFNAYLFLLIPFLGPAFSLFLLQRMPRFFIYCISGLLFLLIPSSSESLSLVKALSSLYIFIEFFVLIFTIPKLDKRTPIPGKYWS